MVLTQETTRLHHLVSLRNLARSDIQSLFDLADWIAARPGSALHALAPGTLIGCCFYQNSTRTRLSFEAAARRIGGTAIGFADVATTRAGDFFNETLEDTVQVVGSYVDLLVLRHVDDDAGERAAAVSPVPVVSAGAGERVHPTQGLLDSWIINRALGSVRGARVGLVGDPNCRATRSILVAQSKLGVAEAVFLPPPGCSVQDDEKIIMADHGVRGREVDCAADLLKQVDAVSMIPFELPDFHVANARRDPDAPPLDRRFVFDRDLLETVGADVHVVHTGPRTAELTAESTELPNVHYFEGVRNGVAMRSAVICRLLGLA
jgi:aspartate carbamoyltransferase catalytic subunit